MNGILSASSQEAYHRTPESLLFTIIKNTYIETLLTLPYWSGELISKHLTHLTLNLHFFILLQKKYIYMFFFSKIL